MVYGWLEIPAGRVPYLRIPSDARWSFQSDAGSRSIQEPDPTDVDANVFLVEPDPNEARP